MPDHEDELRAAMNDALEALAEQLGGTSDTGGPVENATQIKGRDELGVLLTDADERVLGRVWLEFGAAAQTGDASELTTRGGSMSFHASVRSERVMPPLALEEWIKRH